MRDDFSLTQYGATWCLLYSNVHVHPMSRVPEDTHAQSLSAQPGLSGKEQSLCSTWQYSGDSFCRGSKMVLYCQLPEGVGE